MSGLGCAARASPRWGALLGFLLLAAPVSAAAGRICGKQGPGTSRLHVEIAPSLRLAGLSVALCEWLGSERLSVRFVEVSTARRDTGRDSRPRSILRLEPEGQGVRVTLAGHAPSTPRGIRRISSLPRGSPARAEVIAQAAHSLVRLSRLAAFRKSEEAESVDRSITRGAQAESVAGVPSPGREPDSGETQEADTPGQPVFAKAPAESSGVHRVAAGYLGTWRGQEPWSHGPELILELGWRPRGVRYFACAGLHRWRTAAADLASLTLRLRGTDLRAGLGIEWPHGRWSLQAVVDYSLERVRARVGTEGADADLRVLPLTESPQRHFVGLAAGTSVALGSLRLTLQSLLRWQLTPSPYRIQEGDRVAVVATPARLQPGAALRLEYPLPW